MHLNLRTYYQIQVTLSPRKDLKGTLTPVKVRDVALFEMQLTNPLIVVIYGPVAPSGADQVFFVKVTCFFVHL